MPPNLIGGRAPQPHSGAPPAGSLHQAAAPTTGGQILPFCQRKPAGESEPADSPPEWGEPAEEKHKERAQSSKWRRPSARRSRSRGRSRTRHGELASRWTRSRARHRWGRRGEDESPKRGWSNVWSRRGGTKDTGGDKSCLPKQMHCLDVRQLLFVESAVALQLIEFLLNPQACVWGLEYIRAEPSWPPVHQEGRLPLQWGWFGGRSWGCASPRGRHLPGLGRHRHQRWKAALSSQWEVGPPCFNPCVWTGLGQHLDWWVPGPWVRKLRSSQWPRALEEQTRRERRRKNVRGLMRGAEMKGGVRSLQEADGRLGGRSEDIESDLHGYRSGPQRWLQDPAALHQAVGLGKPWGIRGFLRKIAHCPG